VIRSSFLSILVILMATLPTEAATSYRFASTTEGVHPRHRAGRVVIDGPKWRVDFDVAADEVPYLTSVISNGDGTLFALNASNHTWFELDSRRSMGIESPLFSYPGAGPAKALKVVRKSTTPGGDLPFLTISFSYIVEVTLASERVPVAVNGELSAWPCSAAPEQLAWSSTEFATGVKDVDDAMNAATVASNHAACRSEVTVTQSVAKGPNRVAKIRRSIEMLATPPPAVMFTVPAGYVHQKPQYGMSERQ
jgi:hypothetical protein